MRIEDLKVAIYADGADIEKMKQMSRLPYIRGFTTNPTLMRKAGVTDYVSFAKQALAEIPDRPVSMEVFADDFEKMEKEAREISSWGGNVFVKIPVMTTRGESSIPLIRKLSAEGLKLNITAVFTTEQVRGIVDAFAEGTENIVSVFAGRILDAGVDAEEIMKTAVGKRPGGLQYYSGRPVRCGHHYRSGRDYPEVFQSRKRPD